MRFSDGERPAAQACRENENGNLLRINMGKHKTTVIIACPGKFACADNPRPMIFNKF